MNKITALAQNKKLIAHGLLVGCFLVSLISVLFLWKAYARATFLDESIAVLERQQDTLEENAASPAEIAALSSKIADYQQEKIANNSFFTFFLLLLEVTASMGLICLWVPLLLSKGINEEERNKVDGQLKVYIADRNNKYMTLLALEQYRAQANGFMEAGMKRFRSTLKKINPNLRFEEN